MAADPSMVAVTLVFGAQRADVLLPTALPLAELLPGIASRLGQLSAMSATYGFDMIASSGQVLDPALSLADQHVAPGTLLTLTPRSGSDLRRYDDLTEAVGSAVEAIRQPWGATESVTLSVGCAAALCLAAAAVLWLRGGGGIWAALAGVLGAVIATVAARAVAHLVPLRGSMALIVGVCALLGAAGWNLVTPPDQVSGLLAATGGVAVGSAAVFVLPRVDWPAGLGPLIVAASTAVTAGVVLWQGAAWAQAVGALLALLMVLSAVLPSIGLALLPMRIMALSTQQRVVVSRAQAVQEVRNATIAVTAIRAGIAVTLVGATVLLAHSWLGVALVGCCCLSLSIGVRNLYSRIDVLVNTIAAFTALLVGGVLAVWSRPWMALALCGVMVVAVALLVLHAASSSRLRAGLDRWLDLAYMLATIAVIPLAVMLWGVF